MKRKRSPLPASLHASPPQRTSGQICRTRPIYLFCLALSIYLLLWHRLVSLNEHREESEQIEEEETGLITLHPVRSNTGLFVTLGSYLLEGNELVILGVGDFTPHAQPARDAELGKSPQVPRDLECVFGNGQRTVAVAGVNGTAYQNEVSPTRGSLYFGERLLWITCPKPMTVATTTAVVSLQANHGEFHSSFTTPTLVLPAKKPRFDLTICTSAIYGLTGSRWITEWLEHHRANGFDSVDLYVHTVGPLVWQVIDYYVENNSPKFHIRVVNWTSAFDEFQVNTGVGHGVAVEAWEHGQRLTRNDCYLRNRGRSRWIMFSDVDELFSSPTTTVKHVVNEVCEQAHSQDSNKIACSFASVTVPPNAPLPDNPHQLLLERIRQSEFQCQPPYNCGRYHRGREKYAIRTQFGTTNPRTPLFYHAISRDYVLSDRLHVLVPSSLGVVRHYAGHFAHSRKGGLLHPKENPPPSHILQAIQNELHSRPALLDLYQQQQSETFLKLDRVTDLWRFAKYGERPPIASKQSERYLTFDYFKGRLNNQLWTLDWVMRLALSLNRTAVLNKPTNREYFVGFPNSPTDQSLWDVALLKQAPFRFLFHWEVPEEDRDLLVSPETGECVWQYSEKEKYVARWAHHAECGRRMHIASGSGLVHSYKVDTRAYGAQDPLVFWRYMRLHPSVSHLVQMWKGTKTKQESLGLHWRSWREASGTEAHATKVCKRLSDKIVLYASKHLVKTVGCACVTTPSLYNPVDLWENERWFDLTCHPASSHNILAYTKLDSNRQDFFVATDHETVEADEVFLSLGARMISGLDAGHLASKFELATDRRYAKAILPILFDLELMMQVDRFVGSPASTLSHAVCLWRRSMGKPEQVPGMCQLVWWSTFSDLCEERVCLPS